jgi:hypothetical protein
MGGIIVPDKVLIRGKCYEASGHVSASTNPKYDACVSDIELSGFTGELTKAEREYIAELFAINAYGPNVRFTVKP